MSIIKIPLGMCCRCICRCLSLGRCCFCGRHPSITTKSFSRTDWSGLPDLAAPTHKFVWSFLAGFYGRIEHFHTVIKISNMFVKLLAVAAVAQQPSSPAALPFPLSIVGGSRTYKLTFWLPTGAANDQRPTVPSSLRWSSSPLDGAGAAAAVRTSFHVYDPSTRAIKLYTNKRSKDQKPRYLHTESVSMAGLPRFNSLAYLSFWDSLKFIKRVWWLWPLEAAASQTGILVPYFPDGRYIFFVFSRKTLTSLWEDYDYYLSSEWEKYICSLIASWTSWWF